MQSDGFRSLLQTLNLNEFQIGSVSVEEDILTVEYGDLGGEYYFNNHFSRFFMKWMVNNYSNSVKGVTGVYTQLGTVCEFNVEYVSNGYYYIRPSDNNNYTLHLIKTTSDTFTLRIATQPTEVISSTGDSVSSLWKIEEISGVYEITSKLSPAYNGSNSVTYYKLFDVSGSIKCSGEYTNKNSKAKEWRIIDTASYQNASVTSFSLNKTSISCLVGSRDVVRFSINSSATYLRSANEFSVYYSGLSESLVRDNITSGSVFFTGIQAGSVSSSTAIKITHIPTGLFCYISAVDVNYGSGEYVIRNREQNAFMKSTSNGINLTKGTYSDSDNTYRFTILNGTDGYRYIRNSSGLYLTYRTSGVPYFTESNSSNEQLWGVETLDENTVIIYPKITGSTSVLQLRSNGLITLQANPD